MAKTAKSKVVKGRLRLRRLGEECYNEALKREAPTTKGERHVVAMEQREYQGQPENIGQTERRQTSQRVEGRRKRR